MIRNRNLMGDQSFLAAWRARCVVESDQSKKLPFFQSHEHQSYSLKLQRLVTAALQHETDGDVTILRNFGHQIHST